LTIYLNIIQIIVAAALITLTVMQGKNAGLSRMLGGDSSIYRTRRGVDKTLYNLTVIMAVAFFIISLTTVLVSR
jgi:preprotein translocase subunit SecG